MIEQFNISVFLLINQYAGQNEALDNILISAVEIMPYLFILVLIYLWLRSGADGKKSSLNAVFSVFLGMLTSNVISSFYYHPRPFVENLGLQIIEHAADASFPSDHSTFTFSIALMLLFNKTTRAVGGILVAIFSSTVVLTLSQKHLLPTLSPNKSQPRS